MGRDTDKPGERLNEKKATKTLREKLREKKRNRGGLTKRQFSEGKKWGGGERDGKTRE